MSANFTIISVRSSSTRLAGKALKKICGKKTIEIVIERSKRIGFPVIIATSTNNSDDVFERISADNGVNIFRGSLLNRLRRWKDCFDFFDIDNAVLVDGDDLLHDADIGKRAVKLLEDSGCDIVKYPDNIVCSFFGLAMSRKAVGKMKPFMLDEGLDLDVITEFLCQSGLTIAEVDLNDWEKDRSFRLTLDYIEDFDMFEALISEVGINATSKEIVEFLDSHPEVVEINIHRHADFLENQQKFNQSIGKIYSDKGMSPVK